MIDNYHFGSITINGQNYNHDVEVDWRGEVLSWWRKEGHTIDIGDIKRALEKKPEIIVIGTGESGYARVTDEAKKRVESKKIKAVIERTETATQEFSTLKKEGKKVVGLFHLTC